MSWLNSDAPENMIPTFGVFTCHASSGWSNAFAFSNALLKEVHPETSQLFKG